jgi:uncharacterized protein YjbJ (UPF0337 family)
MKLINRLENGKDKALGKIKETAGKIMNSDQLEFQGKMQSMKAGIGEKVEDVKDNVMGKANEIIDKVKEKGNNQ